MEGVEHRCINELCSDKLSASQPHQIADASFWILKQRVLKGEKL